MQSGVQSQATASHGDQRSAQESRVPCNDSRSDASLESIQPELIEFAYAKITAVVHFLPTLCLADSPLLHSNKISDPDLSASVC